MDVNVLLMADESQGKDAYARAIRRAGAACDVVGTFDGFKERIGTRAYHGLILDLRTKMKAFRHHQEFAKRVLDVFPTLLVNWDGAADGIKTIGAAGITEFVRDTCGSQEPRKFREHLRRNAVLNVSLVSDADARADAMQRSVTLNISKGGCFLVSMDDHDVGDQVWLTVHDFEDSTPIAATVRNCQKWGVARRVPGIGVQFIALTDRQEHEIARFFA